jgi:hypothetical protein
VPGRADAWIDWDREDTPTSSGGLDFQTFQSQFGHSKMKSTVRYLGIEVDEAIEIVVKYVVEELT